MKIAGVVTLYHPDKQVIENIKSYIGQLDFLWALDNTESPDSEIKKMVSKLPRIEYVSFGDNKGISYALNYALYKAEGKYDFLLTMDQDSAFYESMMEKYVRLIEENESNNPQKVGVYSVDYDPEFNKRKDPVSRIHVAITSGSVIPVENSLKIGGFDENLFIDEVDTEFCYRMEKNGYEIIEFPFIILKHSIGNRTFHKIFGKNFKSLNHNAMRKYYIVRNKIYVGEKYPEVRGKYLKTIIKLAAKVILVENNKLEKLKYMFYGGIDGFAHKMGKSHRF